MFRNLAADEQPVDRCFFWLQDAGACAPSTQRAERGAPLETVAEEAASAGDAAASVETSSSAAVTAPDGSMQPEGRTQPRMTAEAAALALRRLVQSAASRAQRTGHSSPAFPLLQISGDVWDSTCLGWTSSLWTGPALDLLSSLKIVDLASMQIRTPISVHRPCPIKPLLMALVEEGLVHTHCCFASAMHLG